MIYVVLGIYAVTVAMLILALYRLQVRYLAQQVYHVDCAEAERREAAVERARLLDRIQHPETRQVESVHREPSIPPRDAAEFAQIGQLVPEFVHVGTPSDDPAWEWIGQEVPEGVNVEGASG